MKNTILFIAAFLISGVVSASGTLSGSTTSFGTYTLKQVQPVVVNNVAYKAWTLNYDGSDKRFTVLYSPGADGQSCFTVRNEQFEIQYANVDGNFGVRLVDVQNRTIKKKEVLKQINNEQFMMQSVLTSNPKSEEEYLGLVASFLPLLFA